MDIMQTKSLTLSNIKQVENTRSEIGDLSELMNSLKSQGQLQPVLVAPNWDKKGKEKFILVCGNRRFEAMQKLGKTTILATISPVIKTMDALMVANLTENIQKRTVSAYEQGRFIHTLVTKYKYSKAECASRLGIRVAAVEALIAAYNHTPTRFRNDISGPHESVRKGKVPLTTAKMIIGMQKEGFIDTKEVGNLMEGVREGSQTYATINALRKAVRSGVSLSKAKELNKKTVFIQVQIQFYTSERDSLVGKNGNLIELVREIVYGETGKKFTRPKNQ